MPGANKKKEQLEYDRKVGALVRKVRGDRGQDEVAQQLGISQAALSKIENGKQPARPDQIARLAEIFGCPVSALMPNLAGSAEETLSTEDRVKSEPVAGSAATDHGEGPASAKRPMPKGLEGFLERYAEKPKISRRERHYLVNNSKFYLEDWVVQDDSFWRGQLEFWRKYLREQDALSGEGVGEGDKD